MAGSTGLTTRGRWLLATAVGIALSAILLDERELLRTAVFVAALPLLALAVTAGGRVSMQAHRTVAPTRLLVGVPARVTVELRTRGRVPGAELRLTDAVPAGLGVAPRFVVARLPRRSRTTLRYSVTPRRRGAHVVGPLVAEVTDPFGLTRFSEDLAGCSRLLAVPAAVPLRGLPRGIGPGDGVPVAGLMRSGRSEDDAVVRSYRDGDDRRRVHWRSTARRGELMVRAEERAWCCGVTVLLDRRAAGHRGSGPAASLEWAVRLAASVCLHLLGHGQPVRLVTEDGAVLVAGSDPDAVLDGLAKVADSPARELRPRAVTGTSGTSGTLIALLGATGPGVAQQLLAACSSGVRRFAVVMDVGAWAAPGEDPAPDPGATAAALTAAGWRVSVAGPTTPMPEVWTTLCAAAADSGVVAR